MHVRQPDYTGTAHDLSMAAIWARACYTSLLGREQGEAVYRKARMRALWTLWQSLTPGEA